MFGERDTHANWIQEFDNLKDNEIIYKLVGPVLLKQEKFEADGTVKGRLEFIGNELYVRTPQHPPQSLFCPTHLSATSSLPAPSRRITPAPQHSTHHFRGKECTDEIRERQEKHIKELQKQIDGKRAEIMQIQAAAQAASQGAQQGKEVAA